MKKRLLTAVVGVSVAVAWMFSLYTPVYAAVMAIVAGIAVFEMLRVFGIRNKVFFGFCELIAVGTVLYADYFADKGLPLFPILTAAVLIPLIIMVTDYKNLKFEQVVCALFSALLIPAALSCVVLLRDVYIRFPSVFTREDGVFLIIFSFFCAWITDGCALFAGKAFGKHKLAPVISPKKTVEGAIGGVVGNLAFSAALWAVFRYRIGLSAHIGIVWVLVAAFLLGIVSIFGDLAASTIKRHHGVKDFGNILPGHGGAMDRFDSSVFVFSALYAAVCVMGKILS